MELKNLANGVNTLFIDNKLDVINGLKKLRNTPFWLVVFVVSFCN